MDDYLDSSLIVPSIAKSCEKKRSAAELRRLASVLALTGPNEQARSDRTTNSNELDVSRLELLLEERVGCRSERVEAVGLLADGFNASVERVSESSRRDG